MASKKKLSKEEIGILKEIVELEQDNLVASRLILKSKTPSPYEGKLNDISQKLSKKSPFLE